MTSTAAIQCENCDCWLAEAVHIIMHFSSNMEGHGTTAQNAAKNMALELQLTMTNGIEYSPNKVYAFQRS